MKKYYLLILALATMMVACSKDSESLDNSTPVSKDNTTVATQQPVTFDAYVNRATTRAGAEGVLKTSETGTGKVSLENEGFGVFSFYTDDDLYSSIYQPNFMYNTKVDKTSGSWAYSPVRYWPNEFGANAASEGVDRLSFFAYAPWVQVTPTTGLVTGESTYGIVGLSRNAATGDPFVKYYVNLNPANQVDFCWGVNEAGKLNIDMTKQGINEKVSFQFKHALAALNVQIDAAVDEFTPGNKTLGAETHIYVRSVTFEGFVMKGAFNLNTEHAIWYDLAGNNYIDGGSVTVYDGRTNGREGQSASVNESPVGLNPVIVQTVPYSDNTLSAGVTKTAVNLFNNAGEAASVYVIPSNQPLQVTVVYDVETQNPKLNTYLSDGETHGTSVENKITKTITLNTGGNLKLEAGKQYTVNLHLGMNSVKFDATVNGWEEASAATTGETNLPDNYKGVTSIALNKTELALALNTRTSEQLSVTFTPGDASDDLTWESSDETVATVAADGTVTAVAAGTATITVSTSKGLSKTCAVTVRSVGVTGVTLASMPSWSVLKGNVTQTINTATVTPDNADEKGVTWTSSNTQVGTVDENGLVTILSAGETVITATTIDGNYSASSTLKVLEPVATVSLDKTNLALAPGESYQLIPGYLPTNAYFVEDLCDWETSDDDVVTVDDEGNVTAVGAGNATITLTYYADPYPTATCTVTVSQTIKSLSAYFSDTSHATEASNYLGKYVMADGTFSTSSTDAIGIVAYISTDNTPVDGHPDLADCRVLVLALSDAAGGKMIWGPEVLQNAVGYTLGVSRGTNDNYPAIKAAWNYNSGYSLTGVDSGAKGHWFLPTMDQMKKMGLNDNSASGAWGEVARLDDFWSSTEYGTGNVMTAYQYSNSVFKKWTTFKKDDTSWKAYARPVFAY